nr:4Fe-4S dicluster domain-containing protein [Methanopyrus kandleri]
MRAVRYLRLRVPVRRDHLLIDGEPVTERGVPKLPKNVEVDEDRCVYCGVCMRTCPVDAIQVTKPYQGHIEIDDEECVGCGLCVEICPCNALEFGRDGTAEKTRIVVNLDRVLGPTEKE